MEEWRQGFESNELLNRKPSLQLLIPPFCPLDWFEPGRMICINTCGDLVWLSLRLFWWVPQCAVHHRRFQQATYGNGQIVPRLSKSKWCLGPYLDKGVMVCWLPYCSTYGPDFSSDYVAPHSSQINCHIPLQDIGCH